MDDKLVEIQKLLDAADGNLSSARTMMRELTAGDVQPIALDKKLEGLNAPLDEGKVVEGVFTGDAMKAPDGQVYPVPSNYASKSKLVEGDTLKLTIMNDGSFLFKQIAPTERRNTVGTLALDDGNYTVSAEGKSYKVLTASVTFYKARPGDQITIILPKENDATWAAMENVIKKPTDGQIIENSEPEVVNPTVEEVIMPAEEPVVSEPAPQAEGEESTDEQPPAAPVSEEKGIYMNPSVVTNVEKPVDDVLTTPEVGAQEAQPETPEIEFPGSSATLSDEQLLENLKNNLKNLEQPAYVAPQNVPAKSVDNIVANDMNQLHSQQVVVNNQPQSADKPIAELDI